MTVHLATRPGRAVQPRVESRTVTRRGVRLFVLDEALTPASMNDGTAAPVLLLHGLGLSHTTWEPVADRLLRTGHRVVRLDTRGHGRSDAPASDYRLDDLVADVLAVMDALKIARAHLVGHSLGGTVALQVALHQPARVASLTLAGALVAGQAPPAAFLEWAAQLFELVPLGLPALLDALPSTAPYQHHLGDPDLAREVQRVVGTSLHAAAFLPENFADTRAVATSSPTPWDRASTGELGAPLLTLDGSLDPVVSGIQHPTSDNVPGARGVILPGAGHLALLERPWTVARHIAQHVSAHQPATVTPHR